MYNMLKSLETELKDEIRSQIHQEYGIDPESPVVQDAPWASQASLNECFKGVSFQRASNKELKKKRAELRRLSNSPA